MNRRQRVVILTGCLVLLLLGLFPPYMGDVVQGQSRAIYDTSVFLGYHPILWSPSVPYDMIRMDVWLFASVRIEMDRFWIGFAACIAVTLGLVAVLSSSKPGG